MVLFLIKWYVNGRELVWGKRSQIFQCKPEICAIFIALYLVASADILFRSINVNSIGDVGRLLFDCNEEIQSAPIKAYIAIWILWFLWLFSRKVDFWRSRLRQQFFFRGLSIFFLYKKTKDKHLKWLLSFLFTRMSTKEKTLTHLLKNHRSQCA